MASNNILTYVLVGGAAYLAYNWWQNQQTPALVPVPPTPLPPATPPQAQVPPTAYVPPSTVQQLQNAAGAGVTTLNADQWQFYWNQIGKPAISSDIFTALFFPTGRPSDPSQAPMMTATAFASALASKGLSGGGRGYRRASLGAYGMGQYTMADFRRAGRR
jgi:hypothetical protein